MRIHLISDLHLETGPYHIPESLDYDVLVVAGDVSETPDRAMEFLTSVGKPVVFVLGNHDFWSKGEVDMTERLSQLRALAAGTNVHLLENESVILHGVRFLGCTLWTGYGSNAFDGTRSGSKPNNDLLRIAMTGMNDYHQIADDAWHATNPGRHAAWLSGELGWATPNGQVRQVSPLGLFARHATSLEWLRQELYKRPCDDWTNTVVVTHHAPSWNLLVEAGVVRNLEQADDPRVWAMVDRVDRDDSGVVRLAAYATPLDGFLRQNQQAIDLWCHGHIHRRLDTVIHGVRVVANPRGRSWARYQTQWKAVAVAQGLAAVPPGWQFCLNEPNVGEGRHDNDLLLDPRDGAWPLVADWISAAEPALRELLFELSKLTAHAMAPGLDPWQQLALREAVDKRLQQFDDQVNALNRRVSEALVACHNVLPGALRVCDSNLYHHINWTSAAPADGEGLSAAYEPAVVLQSCEKVIARLCLIPQLRHSAVQAAYKASSVAVAALAKLGVPARALPYEARFLGDEVRLATDLPRTDELQDVCFTALRELSHTLATDFRLLWPS